MDQVRLAGRPGGFWRCQHCGDRFIGPPHDLVTSESGSKGHRRRRNDSELDRSIRFERRLRRWLFPLLVIALTVLAVLFILERRNRQVLDPIHEVN